MEKGCWGVKAKGEEQLKLKGGEGDGEEQEEEQEEREVQRGGKGGAGGVSGRTMGTALSCPETVDTPPLHPAPLLLPQEFCPSSVSLWAQSWHVCRPGGAWVCLCDCPVGLWRVPVARARLQAESPGC